MEETRLEQQLAFVEKHSWADADLFPLPSDASKRTYTRLTRGSESRMLMDAPVESEKLPEYLQIRGHLEKLGLRVPEIFAADTVAGLALIEDFGNDTFTKLLEENTPEEVLYMRAVEVLVQLHRERKAAVQVKVPPYDMALMLEEVGRFLLWFVPAVRGKKVSSAEEEAFFKAWRSVLAQVSLDRSSFVFRDFHVDNLMIIKGDEGLQGCGLLDFQDALIGPAAYDMVSLLEDARRDVTSQTREAVLAYYFDACPEVDRRAFLKEMAVLGAQRHTKVAGLFVRLSVQDGKNLYLKHLPRVVSLMNKALAAPQLLGVRAVILGLVPDFEEISFTEEFMGSMQRA